MRSPHSEYSPPSSIEYHIQRQRYNDEAALRANSYCKERVASSDSLTRLPSHSANQLETNDPRLTFRIMKPSTEQRPNDQFKPSPARAQAGQPTAPAPRRRPLFYRLLRNYDSTRMPMASIPSHPLKHFLDRTAAGNAKAGVEQDKSKLEKSWTENDDGVRAKPGD